MGLLNRFGNVLGRRTFLFESVLERCHAEHTTFEMCRRKVITLVASHLGYITFCLSRGYDHTLLKYLAVKIKL